MKKAKHAFYALLFLIIPSLLQAQPPGYLGKRAFLTIGVSSKPSRKGPTQNGRGFSGFLYGAFESDKKWGLDYEFEGKLSYVIGRYRTLGVTVGQYYTGMFSTATSLSLGANIVNFSDEPIDEHELFHRLNVRSIAVSTSKFNSGKGGLAPLGNQIVYGIKRTFATGEILDKYTDYYFEEISNIYGHGPIGVDDVEVAYNTLILGWSNNQIFFNRLILSVGGRFGIPLSSKAYAALGENADQDPRLDDNFDSIEEVYQNRNRIYYEYGVLDRLVRHEAFRIDVSVGLLLF